MEWLDQLAATLGVDPLGPEEMDDLLDAARDVAHGVERKVTPLAAFQLGMSVERRMTAGTDRAEALAAAMADLRTTLPS
jgi:hypothetical protein